MRAGRLGLATILLAAHFPAAAETVEILRDEFGVPHIFASTPAGTAFGVGVAQAEDRPDVLLRNLSSTEGAEALGPEVRHLAEAFAAGVNQALGREAVTAAHVAAFSRRAFATIEGSGDFILGPERTGGSGVIAVLDPYSTWAGDGRSYELRLYIAEGGRAFSGVTPVGLPFPIVGHSRKIAIGWSGSEDRAGPRALEQAWAMLNAQSLAEAREALAIGAIPGDAILGTASGEIFDSAGLPEEGYVLRRRSSPQADAMIRRVIWGQQTWPLARVAQAAFSAEVWKAEEWQKRLSRTDPGMKLVQMLTGWNRRAEAESIPALGFYLLKMELGREAQMLEPPSSLSDARLRAALDRVRDKLDIELTYASSYGSLFRIVPEGSLESYGVGGGTVTEAGMETPRAIRFEKRGSVSIGVGGQTATQIVQLRPETAEGLSLVKPGLPGTKPAWFADRRALEEHVVSKKELIFSPPEAH